MTTEPEPTANDAQMDYWNTLAGQAWVRFQTQLDRQIEPLGLAAMDVLGPIPGERILDIGCGCGQSTLALAERVRPGGRVLGVDISEPMLEVARNRPRPAADLPLTFAKLDAQTADLAGADLGGGSFDAVFSRFGVMFFSDPVAAFANIRAGLRPVGRLVFVCWRPLSENLWMGAPLAAARPLLPHMAPPDPLAPGPFAFADADRVRGILAAAGFRSVSIEPFHTDVGGGDIEETVALSLNIGPMATILREHPHLRDAVGDAVRTSLAPFVTENGVMMPAAVWIARATNG
jgi:SAM-dependent methyltransferase